MKLTILLMLLIGCSQSIASEEVVYNDNKIISSDNHSAQGSELTKPFHPCSSSGSLITITSDDGNSFVFEVPSICNPNYIEKGRPTPDSKSKSFDEQKVIQK